MRDVRPVLMEKALPGESAMFLTQNGSRLTHASVLTPFRRMLEVSGLDGRGITLNGIRHAGIMAMVTNMDAEKAYRGHHGPQYIDRFVTFDPLDTADTPDGD